jgi:hypothetical protein
MTPVLRFPEWYYGGPYVRIANPDSDLPRRDPTHPVTAEAQADVEFEGTFDGERYVAPFRDANGVDNMIGGLLLASGYPDTWNDEERFRYPTIQGTLARVALRLATKVANNPGRIRANWFTLALTDVRRAAELFASGEYGEAQAHARKAQALIEQGNRAARRKVSFVVGPDGTTSKA